MTADFGFEGEGQFESELCTVRFNLSDGGVAMTKQMYNSFIMLGMWPKEPLIFIPDVVR